MDRILMAELEVSTLLNAEVENRIYTITMEDEASVARIGFMNVRIETLIRRSCLVTPLRQCNVFLTKNTFYRYYLWSGDDADFGLPDISQAFSMFTFQTSPPKRSLRRTFRRSLNNSSLGMDCLYAFRCWRNSVRRSKLVRLL